MPGHAFVYGTLMADEVVSLLIRRVPKAQPAVLSGYKRYRVKGQVFPAILPAASEPSKLQGKVGRASHLPGTLKRGSWLALVPMLMRLLLLHRCCLISQTRSWMCWMVSSVQHLFDLIFGTT